MDASGIGPAYLSDANAGGLPVNLRARNEDWPWADLNGQPIPTNGLLNPFELQGHSPGWHQPVRAPLLTE